MTEFQVGDKVRILNVGGIYGGRSSQLHNGDVVRVVKVSDWGFPLIETPRVGGSPLILANGELSYVELVKEENVAAPQNDRLAEILAQMEALVAEARTLSVEVPAVSKLPQVEADARTDVEHLQSRMIGFTRNLVGNETYRSKRTRVDFHVNTKKNVVTALVRLNAGGDLVERGIARCHPGDTFSEEIGKAIALRRALGLAIPEEYLNVGGM